MAGCAVISFLEDENKLVTIVKEALMTTSRSNSLMSHKHDVMRDILFK